MKIVAVIVLVLIAGAGAFYFLGQSNPISSENSSSIAPAERKSAVKDGTYTVAADESNVSWAGKKPLIEGYVNSGSIAISGGSIEVVDQSKATGTFMLDMTTISVSATPTKPGKESALEEHLKGDRWFDTGAYPTATFEIVEVKARADSATTFMYDVSGNLTLKGQTHELSFPAAIYLDENGNLRADADLEFDRTKWGITSGSDSFFDNLADNAIDDMVALSFNLVAKPQAN